MSDTRSSGRRRGLLLPALALAVAGALLAGASGTLLATCGPFTDAPGDSFCPFVLEIFYLGITTGTTPTTYDPASNVSRLQMAAFLSRTVDGALRRGSTRAALDQFWTPSSSAALGLTTVGNGPLLAACDGRDVWVTNYTGGTVSRVRASDGSLLETWTGATLPSAVTAAMGRIVVTSGNAGKLYAIDPSQPAGAVTTVASGFGVNMNGLAFDGGRFWVTNLGPGSVSIVTPTASIPWTVTTVTAGFSGLYAALYDGANVWVTDNIAGKLLKLDAAGAILTTVTVGTSPSYPAFDGANIWVPNEEGPSVTVVRASTGAILATITNGLTGPFAAAFDGQRVLVTNRGDSSLSLWKAADISRIGELSIGGNPFPQGVCSDGLNFWVALKNPGKLARF